MTNNENVIYTFPLYVREKVYGLYPIATTDITLCSDGITIGSCNIFDLFSKQVLKTLSSIANSTVKLIIYQYVFFNTKPGKIDEENERRGKKRICLIGKSRPYTR